MIQRWYEVVCDTCGCAEHYTGNQKLAESQFRDFGGIISKRRHYCSTVCFAKKKDTPTGSGPH